MAVNNVLRVVESFAFVDPQGIPRVYVAGDLVDVKDPATKNRAHLFESVEANVERTTLRAVEQATAEPGEKRGVRRSKAAAAAEGVTEGP